MVPARFLVLLAIFPLAVAAKLKPTLPATSDPNFAPVIAALQHSAGILSPDVRSAYVTWAEGTVLHQLAVANKTVPPDCLQDISTDPVLRDALFATVDPPDPSILENYMTLRAALGQQFMAKYKSLVIADSVALRRNGAKALPDPNADDGDENDAPAKPSPTPDPLVAAISGYLTVSGTDTRGIYEDPAQPQKLAAYLQAHGIDAASIAKTQDHKKLFDLLKKTLVFRGERPADRDPTPDAATWLHYLTSLYESTPVPAPGLNLSAPIKWPRFPMSSAPWPLLMPLHHAYPLTEAKYIWDKYEGQYGPDRYHTYGPYRMGDGEKSRELRPSAWNWRAWPDILIHGGECTTMAPMSVETHITLGEPAIMAGQPGHCNLMSFRNSGDGWHTVIEQAFAGGPSRTMGAWPFNEVGIAPGLNTQNNHAWCVSEYQIGLALAMDLDLTRYIDTRIAVSIYHRLPPAQAATLGNDLLHGAIQENPFNPAPWYLLAKQTSTAAQGLEIGNLAAGLAQKSADGAYGAAIKKYDRDYWNLIQSKVIEIGILSHPAPEKVTDAQAVEQFLKTHQKVEADKEMTFAIDIEGLPAAEDELEDTLQQHFTNMKATDKTGPEKSFAEQLKSVLQAANETEGAAYLTRLRTDLAKAGPRDPYIALVANASASPSPAPHR